MRSTKVWLQRNGLSHAWFSAGTITVVDKLTGMEHVVQILEVFPYESSRKRMSIIVRLPPVWLHSRPTNHLSYHLKTRARTHTPDRPLVPGVSRLLASTQNVSTSSPLLVTPSDLPLVSHDLQELVRMCGGGPAERLYSKGMHLRHGCCDCGRTHHPSLSSRRRFGVVGDARRLEALCRES